MNWKRRIGLTVAVMALASLVSAGFWGSWYLIAGHLPTVKTFCLSWSTDWELPWVVSRCWDVLGFGLCAGLVTFHLCLPGINQTIDDEIDVSAMVVISLIVTVLGAPMFWWLGPIIPLLILFVIAAFLAVLYSIEENRRWRDLGGTVGGCAIAGAILGSWLGGCIALTYGLSKGMVLGLAVMLMIELTLVLAGALGSFIGAVLGAWQHDHGEDNDAPETGIREAPKNPPPDLRFPNGRRPDWLD